MRFRINADTAPPRLRMDRRNVGWLGPGDRVARCLAAETADADIVERGQELLGRCEVPERDRSRVHIPSRDAVEALMLVQILPGRGSAMRRFLSCALGLCPLVAGRLGTIATTMRKTCRRLYRRPPVRRSLHLLRPTVWAPGIQLVTGPTPSDRSSDSVTPAPHTRPVGVTCPHVPDSACSQCSAGCSI